MLIGNIPMIMTEIVADNVHKLMKYYGMKQTALAKRAGISQRTVSNVLNPGSVESITTDTIEKLAKCFKLPPYRLVMPGYSAEELLDKRIEKVIECYTKVSTDGRENIKRIAENEVRYMNNDQHKNDE
jgi:transcriptional regulator with XRE-family HTH domain